MLRTRWKVALGILLLASMTACQTAPRFEGFSTAAIAKQLADSERIPGISYATIEGGEITSSGFAGIADRETGEPVREDMLFEAASLTKPVVATIAMRLFENGLFDLDESVATVVPAPRIRDQEAYAQVTPRHLLAHMSGLPNWSGNPRNVDRTSALRFASPPGTAYSYSGEGYGILQRFLEEKSGRSMQDLSRELFDELGMAGSTLVGKGHPGETARGHFGLSPSREAGRSERPIAAFSMLTHARDYARFLQYVMREEAWKPEVLATFRRRHVDVDPSDSKGSAPIGWSLGWGALQRPEGAVYFQWGDNGAFRAFAAFSPESRNAVVYFVNGSEGLRYMNELSRPVVGDLSPVASWLSSPGLEWLRRIIRL